MLHLGDITKIDGYTAPIVDVVVGGSPCQDLSVAGKRAGLDGERSGLFMEQLRIIKEMRENDKRNGRTDESIRPRYMVWENVPGAFSSNKSEDFRIVLEETAKVTDENAVIPMPTSGKWTTAGCIVGDGWSIAWRVLDAQFWGVPQRRRRIALVADFGGQSAPEILFVRKSVSGHTEPSQPKRKETPSDVTRGIGADDSIGVDIYNTQLTGDKVNTLVAEGNNSTGFSPKVMTPTNAYTMQDREGKAGGGKGALIAEELSATLRAGFAQTLFQPVYSVENHPADSRVDIDESGKVQTLTSRMGTGGGNVPMIMEACEGNVIALDRSAYNQGKNAQFNIGVDENGTAFSCIAKGPGAVAYIETSDGDIAGTLDASYYKGCGLRQGRERTFVVNAFPEVNYNQFRESNTELATLKAKGGTCGDGSESLIVSTVDCRNGTEDDINGALQSNMAHSLNGNNVVRTRYIVRRLTPLECERLQGYPDNWTLIGEPTEKVVEDFDEDTGEKEGEHIEQEFYYTNSQGKRVKASDAARYKALGNSIALPPWKWVMKRLCACYERDATLASLFDGIGGFPLIWEQINGKGSCLWASEIEEFPIAVTKVRIGE